MDDANIEGKINDCFSQTRIGAVYEDTIRLVEKIIIKKALERSYGNQVAAAKILGVNRNTLRAKIRKLNIQVGLFKQ